MLPLDALFAIGLSLRGGDSWTWEVTLERRHQAIGLKDDKYEHPQVVDVGVSENSGTPKSSILIGFPTIKPSILGYPYFWKHPYISPCFCFICCSLHFLTFCRS